MKNNDKSETNEDFAAYFEKNMGKMEDFKPGQAVQSTILAISKEYVFIELNGKSEGVLEKDELLDSNGELPYKNGDTITAYFLESRRGELFFTTKIAGEKAGSAMLESAFKNEIPVEGFVESEIKGGFQVKIGDTKAFCPYSQMGFRKSDGPASFIGKTLQFRISEYRENGRRIVVSNKILLEDAHKTKLEEIKKNLSEGMRVIGTVVSIQDYGAFVDLGGVQALLPISEYSRDRVADLKTVLEPGQEIEAQILKIDWQAERISISTKILETDPWASIGNKYQRGDIVVGKIARSGKFGIFVSLEPGLDGLVHSSALRDDGTGKGKADFKQGQSMRVQIQEIDVAARRISLKQADSMIADESTQKYLDAETSNDTYNPFAALLKKK